MSPLQGPRSAEPKLTVQDNHKPQFVNCSRYQPSVKEEQPAGTYVFQVKAVDKDPVENGGNITYTFVVSPNERLGFSIEPHTGIIKTESVSIPPPPARPSSCRPALANAALLTVLFAGVRQGRAAPGEGRVPERQSDRQRPPAAGRRLPHQGDHRGRERQSAGLRQSGECPRPPPIGSPRPGSRRVENRRLIHHVFLSLRFSEDTSGRFVCTKFARNDPAHFFSSVFSDND